MKRENLLCLCSLLQIFWHVRLVQLNVNNNINGINGDPNGDGRGIEIHTLHIPVVTELQEAYVRKVIDTVNDMDNVLYEIANESGNYFTEWQYCVIN